MGKKYASIHIRTNNRENIYDLVKNNYYGTKEDIIIQKNYEKILKSCSCKNIIENLIKEIHIIISKDYISIYDENVSFESIKNKAKYLSSNINYPLIYTSNFDDDVFIIGIFKLGKLITSGSLGENLSAYEIKHKAIDINKLCSEIDYEKPDTLEGINNITDIEAIEYEIEKLLQVPLNFNMERVLFKNIFNDMFLNTKINIYEMV